MAMAAVAEATAAQVISKLDEAFRHLLLVQVAEAELPDAGGVDQLGGLGVGQGIEPRRGGGVGALARVLRQRADAKFLVGQQAVDQRRLADAALAHEHRGAPGQAGVQGIEALLALGGGGHHRVAQPLAAILGQQVDLVEHQHRGDASGLGGDQVAVDQVGVGLGLHGEDDQDLVDIGRHRLELAPGVGAFQHAVALAPGHHHAFHHAALGVLAAAPDHPVAGHQPFEVGAQVAAHRRFAGLGTHVQGVAEVGDHPAGPLRAILAGGQLVAITGIALGGALGALGLDLLDAPALLAAKLAFAHGGLMLGTIPALYSSTAPAVAKTRAGARSQGRLMAQNDDRQDPRKQRLVWIDLEMTGLDLEKERIIEVATLVTDAELNVVAEGPVIAVSQPDGLLDAMDSWCTKTHGESGLTARVKASSVDTAEAERRTLEFLREHVAPGTSPMCGNSVHQDRRFMEREMPELLAFFHYRNLDVSTLKELARRWNPGAMAGFQKRNVHLAMDDIKESIAELAHYRETFLRLPGQWSDEEE